MLGRQKSIPSGCPVEAIRKQTYEEVNGLRGGVQEQDWKDGRLEASGEGPQPVKDMRGDGDDDDMIKQKALCKSCREIV